MSWTLASALLAFLLVVAHSTVSNDIQAMMKEMQQRQVEEDKASLEMLEKEKLQLQNISAANASGKSCDLDLPLDIPDADLRGSESNPISSESDWAKQTIDTIWSDPQLSGFVALSPEETKVLNADASHRKGCRPSTFGESVEDYEGVFNDERIRLVPSDVYFDLGGGVGKAVVYTFLKFNISRGVSVELSTTRFDRSCQALQRFQQMVRSGQLNCDAHCRTRLATPGLLQMLHADMLTIDFSRATVVTIWSECLPPSLMAALQTKLLRELPDGARVYDRGAGWSAQPLGGEKRMRSLGEFQLGVAYRIESVQLTDENVEL